MLYGRQQGRAVKSYKKELLEEFLPKIRLTIEEEKVICQTSYNEYKEIWLEIGFGNGDHLAFLAEKYPNILMIGCEPFVNGVGTFLSTIQEKKLSNIRIFMGAAQLLLQVLPKKYFSKAFLLFPDPWPKKRHHKRRFVAPRNLSLLAEVLKKGAGLLFSTDHENYREWSLEAFKACDEFHISSQGFEPPKDWVQTRFQEKGVQEGRRAYFVQLKRV